MVTIHRGEQPYKEAVAQGPLSAHFLFQHIRQGVHHTQTASRTSYNNKRPTPKASISLDSQRGTASRRPRSGPQVDGYPHSLSELLPPSSPNYRAFCWSLSLFPGGNGCTANPAQRRTTLFYPQFNGWLHQAGQSSMSLSNMASILSKSGRFKYLTPHSNILQDDKSLSFLGLI